MDNLKELGKQFGKEDLITDLNIFTPYIPKHVHLRADLWVLARFKKDEIQFNRKHIIDEFEKWQEEFLNNPKTTVAPTFMDMLNNILTQNGMKDSIDRDLGVITTTTVRYMGIGTGTTSEDETQATLVTELSGGGYARHDLTTDGQRTRVNLTAKYGTTWDDGDMAEPQSISEGGLFDSLTGGRMHARVRNTTFTLNTGDLFIIQINELHANGTL